MGPFRVLFLTFMGLAIGSSSACGGSLSHRSVAEVAHALAMPDGASRIRIEIQNGTLEIAPPDGDARARTVTVEGGARRAADTAEQLRLLEQVPLELQVVPAPDQPGLLLLRGPAVPQEGHGLIGYEVNLRLPVDVPLEIAVAANGNVEVRGRRARTEVATGRGDLVFGECSGGVFARTGRGKVIVHAHSGDLDVHSKVGDMQAFVPAPGELIELVTGQGNVQLQVPRGLEFDLDARAETGKIGTGFDLEVQRVGRYGAALVGRRGAATTRVILRTGSGHLSISPRDFGK